MAKLTSLEWLVLNDTQVSDLTPVAKLTSLKWLYLEYTQVSDLTPLAKLTSLQDLDLLHTPVAEEQVKKLQEALPNCKIIWYPP